MGVTILCKKTNKNMDMGYFSFNNLRKKVAELANPAFAQHYAKLFTLLLTSHEINTMDEDARKKMAAAYDAETERFISEKLVSVKIVDFCFQSDLEGRIRYGACKELLRVIGDYDDDVMYGYVCNGDNARFAQFKAILQDCVRTKSDLVWR